MNEIKYFPLVGVGRDLRPMASNANRAKMKTFNFYLEETVPGAFRLYSQQTVTATEAAALHIQCPHCFGRSLEPFSPPKTGRIHSLYRCPNCGKH